MSFLLGIGDWLQGLISIFPKLVYYLTMAFVTVLDVFQFAIRKLAGLDVYYVDGVTEQTGDVALSFIRAIFDANSNMPAIKNAFWSLVILGVIMLVIATIIATIRTEYSGGDNSKNKVISNAIKSMFLFFIVPISVLFGLMLSDAFLVAIDKATSTAGGASTLLTSEVTSKLQASNVNGQTTYTNYDIFKGAIPSNTQTLSGIVFQTAAFSANRVRINQDFDGTPFAEHIKAGTIGNLGIFQYADTVEERAKMIDEAFAHNVVFNASAGDVKLNLGAFKDMAGVGPWTATDNMRVTNLSKFNVSLVWVYYDLWHFNYVIAFAFIYVLMKIMTNIVIGLMKRLIELVTLFMISPPIVAIMPLDDGKTFSRWRENFLARALSVIGVIVGFNIFFLLLPYIQQINFLDPTIGAFRFVNLLINSVIMIVALQSIESMIAIISKMVGADDPNKAGGTLVKEVGDTVKRAGVLAGGAAGIAVTGITSVGTKTIGGAGKLAGKGLGKVDKKFFGGMGGLIAERTKDDISSIKNWITSIGKHKEIKDTKESADKEWQDNVGKSYDEKMEADQSYINEMQDAYNDAISAGDYSGSYENFMKEKQSAQAKQKAAANYADRIGMSKEKYVDDYTKSHAVERDVFVANKVKEKHAQIYSERKEGVKKAYGKIKKAVVGTTKYIYQHTGGSVVEDTLKDIKDATIRGGKGGLKSTLYAFKGYTAQEEREAEEQRKFDKEEALKDAARRQLEKERNSKASKEDKEG